MSGMAPIRQLGGHPQKYLEVLPREKGEERGCGAMPPSMHEFVTEVCPLFTSAEWEVYKPSLKSMFREALKADLLNIEGEWCGCFSVGFPYSLVLQYLVDLNSAEEPVKFLPNHRCRS